MNELPISFVSASDIITAMQGRTITDGAINEDGMHICLSDGRVLVVVGNFVLSLCTIGEAVVH